MGIFYTVFSKCIRRKILHNGDTGWHDIITNCEIKNSRKGFLDASLMWPWLELRANFITPVTVLCNRVFTAHTYIWCLFIDLFLNLSAAPVFWRDFAWLQNSGLSCVSGACTRLNSGFDADLRENSHALFSLPCSHVYAPLCGSGLDSCC